MIALAKPAVLLAESVSQAVTSWPAVALATIGVIGGWGTLIIQARLAARKNSATSSAVHEIKEQVTNGGTNLAATIGEINRRTELMEGYFDNLPSQQDIRRINGKLDSLGRSLDTERAARRTLENRFKRAFPEPGD